MVVVTSNQFNEHGWFLPITSATFFPSYLVHCTHCVEWQSNIGNDIRKHFLNNPQCRDVFQKMVLPFQIVSNNDNEVSLHPVVLHPHLSLQFKSLKEDFCTWAFHPGHNVRMSCQVSLLSGQWFALVIQRLRHVLQSWVLDVVHVLERLSCKSCDYVRTTSVTQPKVSQRWREMEMKRKRIEVVIMA